MSHDSSVSKDIRETFPADWPKWVLRSLTELSRAEGLVTNSPTVKSFPLWVQNMIGETVKVMLPEIKFPSKKRPTFHESGPEFLGKIIGHLDYLFESEDAEAAIDDISTRLNKGRERIDADCKETLPDEEYDKLMILGEEYTEHLQLLGQLVIKVIAKKAEVIKRSLRRTMSQPFEERREFFKSYSAAAETPLFNDQSNLEHATSRTHIFLILILFYPMIEKREHINSISDLHQWLVKILNRPRLEREVVRKICNENKLSFAENEDDIDREK